MIIQVQSIVEINEIQKELTFEFEYSPAEKGSRGYYGEQIEPDVESEMEFFAAYDEDGEEIEITCKDEIECARQLAWQEVCED